MRIVISLLLLSLLSACADLPPAVVATPPVRDSMDPARLSPLAECEFAATRQQTASAPPYCASATLRGVIPEAPEDLARLASMTLVSIQLAFGNTHYSQLDGHDLFPVISLNLNQYLGDVSNYAKMRSLQDNALSYLDSQHAQQWLARDLVPCLLGGSISARVKDKGQIGRVDTGDQLSLSEANCLTASFSTPPGTASFQLYEVGAVTGPHMRLNVSGRLRRDLQGLAMTSSAPLGALDFSSEDGGSVRYDGNQIAYCIGAASTLEDSIDSLCSRLAVVMKNIHATRSHLGHGLYLKDIGYFSIAYDKDLNSTHGIAASEYQITSFELKSAEKNALPEAGVLTIMGRFDERLILTFHGSGDTDMLRMNSRGEQQKQTLRTAELFRNTRWHEAVSPAPAPVSGAKQAQAAATAPAQTPKLEQQQAPAGVPGPAAQHGETAESP